MSNMLFVVSLITIVGVIVSWKTMRQQNMRAPLLAAAIIVAIIQCFAVIPAGHIGVVDFLGKVDDVTLKSGVNFVNPLARVIKLSVKTQEIKEIMPVPSKEGLNVSLEISILFHLDPDKAASVYKTVGENYVDIILIPQFRSVVRGVTAMYEAKALYTSERETLSQLIKSELDKQVSARGIAIETTPLRSIVLPADLTRAIEEKLRAEQESQRMQFVLVKEKQESERKQIEAAGIAAFQTIVAKGISEQLLRWKGIEATEKLANSTNTKVIIVGGKDGLPLIMDAK